MRVLLLMRFLWIVGFVVILNPAHALDKDYHIAIDGTNLHFRVRGRSAANPYLLILHGGPGFSSFMFYPWGPALETKLNVVYLDQRGCGQSARNTLSPNLKATTTNAIKGYTISNMIKDIEGVRRFLKVKKWFVLGHSWGGMLGLEYILHSREHVLGFVDMDGVVSWPAMQRSIVEQCRLRFIKMQHSGAAQHAQGTSLLRILEHVAEQPLFSPTRMEAEFQLAMGPANLYFPAGQADAFAAFQTKIATAVATYHVPATALYPAVLPALGLFQNDHLLTRDDTPLLGKVTIPTLIIEGKEDGLITPAMAEIAHNKIKGSQLLELNNCGHFPFVSRPARTALAVLQFVGEVEKHGFKEQRSAR